MSERQNRVRMADYAPGGKKDLLPELSQHGPNQFDDDGNEYVPISEFRQVIAQRDRLVEAFTDLVMGVESHLACGGWMPEYNRILTSLHDSLDRAREALREVEG